MELNEKSAMPKIKKEIYNTLELNENKNTIYITQ